DWKSDPVCYILLRNGTGIGRSHLDHPMQTRAQWYREAAINLGLPQLIRRQITRAIGSQGLHKLTSKLLQFPVYARPGTSDYAVFDQIFVENQYKFLPDLPERSLIIDCGANVGYSAAYFLSRYPLSTVVAVEPERGNFDMLMRNIAPYRSQEPFHDRILPLM